MDFDPADFVAAFVNAESFRIDEDEKYFMLICVNEIGVVSFWKINQYAEDEPSLINTEQLNLNVHTLYWHSTSDREGINENKFPKSCGY